MSQHNPLMQDTAYWKKRFDSSIDLRISADIRCTWHPWQARSLRLCIHSILHHVWWEDLGEEDMQSWSLVVPVIRIIVCTPRLQPVIIPQAVLEIVFILYKRKYLHELTQDWCILTNAFQEHKTRGKLIWLSISSSFSQNCSKPHTWLVAIIMQIISFSTLYIEVLHQPKGDPPKSQSTSTDYPKPAHRHDLRMDNVCHGLSAQRGHCPCRSLGIWRQTIKPAMKWCQFRWWTQRGSTISDLTFCLRHV